MTELQINQSIAEYCGWQILEPEVHPAITYHWAIEPDGSKSILPDYCNDLNEMRKAELTLWHDECLVEKYEENLKKEFLYQVGYQGAAYWFMANAYTKAVAFVKAIGKWKK